LFFGNRLRVFLDIGGLQFIGEFLLLRSYYAGFPSLFGDFRSMLGFILFALSLLFSSLFSQFLLPLRFFGCLPGLLLPSFLICDCFLFGLERRLLSEDIGLLLSDHGQLSVEVDGLFRFLLCLILLLQ
jgi:hypothetical protein